MFVCMSASRSVLAESAFLEFRGCVGRKEVPSVLTKIGFSIVELLVTEHCPSKATIFDWSVQLTVLDWSDTCPFVHAFQ